MKIKLDSKKLAKIVKNFCMKRSLKIPLIMYSSKKFSYATKDTIYFFKTKNSFTKIIHALKTYETMHLRNESINEQSLNHIQSLGITKDIIDSKYINLENTGRRILKIKIEGSDNKSNCNLVLLIDFKNKKIYEIKDEMYLEA